jgi:CDP-diacylglycerol--glycerol-3-phosphate 3-phosphatidyltransferase/cardiolipin synthase
MNLQFLLPQIITTIRLVCAPFIFFSIYEDLKTFAFVFFILIILTDILDGMLARKYNVSTTFGGYYDVTVDFVVIMFAFYVFVFKNIYPIWLLILFILFFILFIITSNLKKLVYYPIGKYYGAMLFITIGITLFYSKNPIPILILIIIIIFTIITFISRISRIFSLKNID